MLTVTRLSVASSCLALGMGAVNAETQSGVDVSTSLYVLDFAGDGIALTSAANGVEFDIDGTGRRIRVAWTTAGSDDAFLALDVNKNRLIDSARELISTRTSLPDRAVVTSANEVLHRLQGLGTQVPGTRLPPGSANFDPADSAFASLLVWVDQNHDGRSQPVELRSAEAARIRSIYGGFQRSRAVDANGNQTLLTGMFMLGQQGAELYRPLAIVRLAR